MPPKKRKWTAKRTAVKEPPSTSTTSTLVTGAAVVRKGACTRCRARKIKCEWISSTSTCKACECNGLQEECASTTGSKPPSHDSAQRATRSQSVPPAGTAVTDSIPAVAQENAHIAGGRKRSHSQATGSSARISELEDRRTRVRTNGSNSGTNASSAATRTSFASTKTTLEVITEFDEESQFTGHTAVSTGTDASLDSQHYKKATAFASLVRTISDDDSDNFGEYSSDDLDDIEVVSNVAPKAKRGRKPAVRKPSSSNGRRAKGDEYANDSDEYNPETCVFKIPSAVKNPDGANSPFIISSSTSLEELRNIVADKLGRDDPSIIQLRYKLASDKAKAPATSICDDDELQIFIENMRALLVPQLLPNGKPSKRAPPKNSTVCFEDAMMEVKATENVGSKGKAKKNEQVAHDPLVEQRTVILGELQKRWRCEYHSKGRDAWCHFETSTGICYEMNLHHLNFWTNRVLDSQATIDVKPSSLILREARKTSIRSSARASVEPSGPPPFQLGSQNYVPIPIVLPQPWQYPGAMTSTGQPSATGAVPSHNVPSILPEQLEIEQWFQELEANTSRNQDGMNFAGLGKELKQNGFKRITQLSRDILGIKDLQEILKINAGTAAMIMEYAQEDVRRFREAGGTL